MDESKELSDKDIEVIRNRANAATAGPWVSYIEGRDHLSGSNIIKMAKDTPKEKDVELHGAEPADYDFIANARQDIPRLLDQIEKLQNAMKDRA